MIVKADECKVTIKEDVTEKESIEGGKCARCMVEIHDREFRGIMQEWGVSPSSFLTAIIRRLKCLRIV